MPIGLPTVYSSDLISKAVSETMSAPNTYSNSIARGYRGTVAPGDSREGICPYSLRHRNKFVPLCRPIQRDG